MIEVMLFVGAVLVIFVVWICCGRVDNAFALEFKESIEKRFQRYIRIETNSYKTREGNGPGNGNEQVL